MKSNYKGNLRKDVVDAIREGYGIPQIPDLLGISNQTLYNALSDLVQAGALIRLERGVYSIPPHSTEAPNGSNGSEGGHQVKPFKPVERLGRTVQLPEYMRTRSSVTVFVEQSPIEIENVLRLELCIGNQWIAIPVSGDMRVCVGTDIPRWSENQETYTNIGAYRLTFKNGEQGEYPHNPEVPLTIDRK